MKLYESLTLACLFAAACGNDVGVYGDVTDAGADTGLPCEIASLLADHCSSCHGSPLAGGAPRRITTYDDLVRTKNGETIAALSLARMTSATAPMPPTPAAPLPAVSVDAFRAWIDGGMPRGSCAGGSGPFDTPPRCTSGRYWTSGNSGSSSMHPGSACAGCHTSGEEAFTLGGTVYPTAHEPTDCYGIGGATIQITDARGAVTTFTANGAGNFHAYAAFAYPIHATVIANGKTRVMAGAVMTADCNSCHTQTGAQAAPGRIVMP